MIERQNYLDVCSFIEYRERDLQNDPATIKRARTNLKHLLQWADGVPFPRAQTIKKVYPEYLLTARNDGKEKQLVPTTLAKACTYARLFFQWARINHPMRYKEVKEGWIETLYPRRSKGTQTVLKKREAWTLEDVNKIASLEVTNLPDTRDQAAICFLFLSGMRITAFGTLPVNCVDIRRKRIKQLPEMGVETKNRKAAITSLLPIPNLLEIVERWDEKIRSNLSGDALWYPRLGWEGKTFVNEICSFKTPEGRRQSIVSGIKRLCEMAGVPYRSPHKLRHGHAVWGLKHSKTIEQFKAVSQNLMHNNLGITDSIYAILTPDDVAASLAGLGDETKSPLVLDSQDRNQTLEQINELLKRL